MTANSALPRVSVVIPTHNPRMDYLRRVLEALRGQTLEQRSWELVIVDNGSREPLAGVSRQSQLAGYDRPVSQTRLSVGSENPNCIDLSWHGNARIVREEKLGLTFARLRGFAEAKGELIVMVDDDNVLAPDYLETSVRIAQEHPTLGAFGGKCLPEFEVEPPEWLVARGKGLGLRDLGDREEFSPEAAIAESQKVERCERGKVKRKVSEFPDCAPIGAGMVLRREAAAAYAARIDEKTKSLRDEKTITDRKGGSLASGGDNDICLTVVEEGWQVGYLPQLVLTHLIPKGRMTLDYQRRMARDAVRSYLLMLDQHGIRPHAKIPRWSVPLRIAKDFLRVQPWRSPEASLEWHSHIGQYLARAELA